MNGHIYGFAPKCRPSIDNWPQSSQKYSAANCVALCSHVLPANSSAAIIHTTGVSTSAQKQQEEHAIFRMFRRSKGPDDPSLITEGLKVNKNWKCFHQHIYMPLRQPSSLLSLLYATVMYLLLFAKCCHPASVVASASESASAPTLTIPHMNSRISARNRRRLQEQQQPQETLTITTTFDGGTAQSGAMFDIVTKNLPITIATMDVHTPSNNANDAIEVWTKEDTFVDYEHDPSAWVMVGCGVITGRGFGVPSIIPQQNMDWIRVAATSRKSIYTSFVSPSGAYMQYSVSNMVTGEVFVENIHLQVLVGSGMTYYFGPVVYEDRVWNGVLHYMLGWPSKAADDTARGSGDCRPSVAPTQMPSGVPSRSHSVVPSMKPSIKPSDFPSQFPSDIPTLHPSVLPSIIPSVLPSDAPSGVPSNIPSLIPTPLPSIAYTSLAPSALPSISPSEIPSVEPSIVYSHAPSNTPSIMSTNAPSKNPTQLPSTIPTQAPSSHPSVKPSESEAVIVKVGRSNRPSAVPSTIPSTLPSNSPRNIPSSMPSIIHSHVPSIYPSKRPSASPSKKPSIQPSIGRSSEPSESNSGSMLTQKVAVTAVLAAAAGAAAAATAASSVAASSVAAAAVAAGSGKTRSQKERSPDDKNNKTITREDHTADNADADADLDLLDAEYSDDDSSDNEKFGFVAGQHYEEAILAVTTGNAAAAAAAAVAAGGMMSVTLHSHSNGAAEKQSNYSHNHHQYHHTRSNPDESNPDIIQNWNMPVRRSNAVGHNMHHTEIIMQSMSKNMEEGRIINWLKVEGERICKNDSIAIIDTNCSSVGLTYIASPGHGYLAGIVVEEREIVRVGELVALLSQNMEDVPVLKIYAGTLRKKMEEENISQQQLDNRSGKKLGSKYLRQTETRLSGNDDNLFYNLIG